MDNSVRQFQPFRRHLALQGAIFLIWHPRNYFQTMRRVTHVFFVPAVLGYCHDFPAGVAVRTLGAARQKSLCKIDQSQKRPLENSKGTRGNGKGSTALTVLLGFQNQTDEMRSPTEGATAAIFVSRSTTERRSTRAACAQVRARSSKSCLSLLVSALEAESMASFAYCQNRSLFIDMAPST
jgi:hypothetical protein